MLGTRQIGKTTMVQQAIESLGQPHHWASGDEPTLRDETWLEQQWEIGRLRAQRGPAVLVIDEVQKARHWSEAVKRPWDEDPRRRCKLRVVLLGSALHDTDSTASCSSAPTASASKSSCATR